LPLSEALYYFGGFVKLLSKFFILGVLGLPLSVFSAEGWMPNGYEVSVIDSVVADNFTYLTLEGYTNPACNNNRIALNHSSKAKFDQMFSMVLSAFHSGAKIKFYFPDTSNCNSTRILLIK
jgi:hypothetical protein